MTGIKMTNAASSGEKLLTPANIVTTVRIVLIPVFVFLLLAPWPSWVSDPQFAQILKPWVAAIVFTLLALTDGLDGYLARSRNEVTNLGKFLDPLADKILVTAALLALIELDNLPAWVALVIIGRDFLISGLRMVASAENQVIAASYIGKVKTVVQIIAVIMFIVKDSSLILGFGEGFALFVNLASWTVMIVALALTLLSMIDYFIKSSHVLGLPIVARSKDVTKKMAVEFSSVQEPDGAWARIGDVDGGDRDGTDGASVAMRGETRCDGDEQNKS